MSAAGRMGRLGGRLTDGLALFGRVENLLGTDYEEIFSYGGAGRAAYGGVRVAF